MRSSAWIAKAIVALAPDHPAPAGDEGRDEMSKQDQLPAKGEAPHGGAKAIASHITAILDALPEAIAERLREDMARFRRESDARRVGPYRDRRGPWARKNVKDKPAA